MSALTCPKCQGEMRTYERSGVTVDQCGNCRGLFLDYGELERLIDGEGRFNAQPPPTPSGYQHDPRNSRRRGFLGGLFGEDD